LEAEKDRLAESQAREYIMGKEKKRREREAKGLPTRRKLVSNKVDEGDTRSEISMSCSETEGENE
jgi:hypothetical protein